MLTNEEDLEHFWPLAENFLYAPEIGLSLRFLRPDWWEEWINERRRERYLLPNALGYAFLVHLENTVAKEDLVEVITLALQNSGSRIRLALEYRGNHNPDSDFSYGKEVSLLEHKNYLRLVHTPNYIETMSRVYIEKDNFLLARKTPLSRESITENLGCLALALEKMAEAERSGSASYHIPFHSGLVEKEKGRDRGLINTLSVLAADTISKSSKRVVVINLSKRHHIGTQDIFYHSDKVYTISLHDPLPSYTGTGGEENIGIGRGEGYNENIEWQPGREISSRVFHYRPNMVLVRADDTGKKMLPYLEEMLHKLKCPHLFESNSEEVIKAWRSLNA